MSDPRERFQELADAGARHGRTPGPEAALRRARQRRLRVAGVTAAILVVAVVAVAVGADRCWSPGTPPTAGPG